MSMQQEPVQARCEMIIRGDGVIRVSLAGEVDLDVSSVVEPALERAQSEVPLVVVDLAQVSFMDSTGVHMLLEADERARRDRTRLVVAQPPECVRRLLALTDTLGVLTIDDRQGATSSDNGS